jgi:predicted DNA-binding protein (MmcQ/YjbR family)
MKSEPVLIDSLVLRPGFHRAYHMNKTRWLSVELNDTISSEEIKSLIDLSFELTQKKKR